MELVKSKKGFTLIEILLVVAAIAILAGIVILAINPNKQLGDTRNAQRRVDVNTILNAVYQYTIDNNGTLPTTVSTTLVEICRSTIATSSCGSLTNLTDVLAASQKYLVSLPTDPIAVSASGTGYFISKSSNGRLTVSAPSAEQSSTISITR
ncbi:MAG: prepilin-type N-terminal cleavage/methylation domain-containing protein [Patescibacteria group bacterium]